MEKLVGKGVLDAGRRMAPVKLAIGLLYRELDAAKGDHAVTVDRALFESVITTMELVVEDLELRSRAEERKAVDGQPRIAAQPQRA